LKALFICDEKEEWNYLRNIFRAHFSKVELVCAIKGADAIEALNFQGPFTMIMIECGIKSDNPSELAREIYESIGERPIIFIGTEVMLKDRVDNDLIETSDSAQIYKKPYEVNQFKEIIQVSLEWAQKEDFVNSVIELNRDEFVPLKLRNFYLFRTSPFDAYIELTKTKYIKALSKDKPYTQSQIQDIGKRGIRVLYLHKDEQLKFLENSIDKISTVLSKKGMQTKLILQTEIAGVLVIHQYLKSVGVTDKLTQFINVIMEASAKLYETTSTLTDILKNFPYEHLDLAEQAVLKALISEGLMRGMGWSSEMTRSKLTLASYLHDVYLPDEKMIRITHLEHPELESYSEREREEFINHMRKAADIAKQFSGISEADFIIEEHHELPDGSGFPRRYNASKLTAISSVFVLTSNFVTQLAIHGPSKLTMTSVLGAMNNHYNVGHFKEPLKILKKAVKDLG